VRVLGASGAGYVRAKPLDLSKQSEIETAGSKLVPVSESAMSGLLGVGQQCGGFISACAGDLKCRKINLSSRNIARSRLCIPEDSYDDCVCAWGATVGQRVRGTVKTGSSTGMAPGDAGTIDEVSADGLAVSIVLDSGARRVARLDASFPEFVDSWPPPLDSQPGVGGEYGYLPGDRVRSRADGTTGTVASEPENFPWIDEDFLGKSMNDYAYKVSSDSNNGVFLIPGDELEMLQPSTLDLNEYVKVYVSYLRNRSGRDQTSWPTSRVVGSSRGRGYSLKQLDETEDYYATGVRRFLASLPFEGEVVEQEQEEESKKE